MVVHPSGTWYGARVQYDQKLVQHGGTISKQIGAFMWYITLGNYIPVMQPSRFNGCIMYSMTFATPKDFSS